MKATMWSALCLFLLAVSMMGMGDRPPIGQGGKIRIVASIPDLADITARIGGGSCVG